MWLVNKNQDLITIKKINVHMHAHAHTACTLLYNNGSASNFVCVCLLVGRTIEKRGKLWSQKSYNACASCIRHFPTETCIAFYMRKKKFAIPIYYISSFPALVVKRNLLQ